MALWRPSLNPKSFVLLAVVATSLVLAGGIVLAASDNSALPISDSSRPESQAAAWIPVSPTASATQESTPVAQASQPVEEEPLPPAAPVEMQPSDSTAPPPVIALPQSEAPAQPPSLPAPPTATPLPPPPTPTVAAPPAALPPAAPVTLSGLEQQLFSLHQTERTRAGMTAFVMDATLTSVARQRANDMAAQGYFSHTSPSGSTAFTILALTGHAYTLAGENIARNNYPDGQSASVAMSGFMSSPTHRDNLLEVSFRRIGIGASTGAEGMKYIAVVFSD